MSDSAGRKTSAKRKSPAAGKDSGAQKQRKERTRRRIRLMYWGNSSSSSLVYIIPDFSASANFCRIFFCLQQMTTIGIQCSIRQPVQYSSAGIRNPVFRQQLFAARRLFIQANEASRQPLYYLTGQYSPARLIFFTGQISDFRLRTTLLSRRLRRRQPRFRSHKQINKRTFQKNSQKNFKNNSKSNPKEPK